MASAQPIQQVQAVQPIQQPQVQSPVQSAQPSDVEPVVQQAALQNEPIQDTVDDEGGFYHAGTDEDESPEPSPRRSYQEADPVEWISGNENFRAHASNWRLKMSLLAIVGAALVFLVTRSYLTSGVIVVAGILFGVLGARPPRPINYRLDGQGMSVGFKRFSYGEFRAFSVSDTTPTVNLVPLKRFAPIMVLRFDPTVAADVVKALSAHLPMEAPRQDAVDSLVNRLRI